MSRLASLLCCALALGCSRGPERIAERPVPRDDRAARAAEVRAELRHAWDGYVRYAWGHDELRPLTRAGRDWYAHTLLITPVDALDALYLLGFADEADRTRDYIDRRLTFDLDISVKNFEITIRVLGGLLSAHQISGDPRLLALAEDLGRRLLPAFDSPTGMPYVNVNLRTGKTSGAESNPAEIGTLLLEFGTLARLTHDDRYYAKAKRALVELDRRRSPLGLPGESIDVETGVWKGTASHIGGGIDSYYEYLLKAWILFGDEDCRRMWLASIAALNRAVADERPDGLWYGEVDMATGRRTATEIGALHAFFPAVLALGGDVPRARRLQESLFRMWTENGIEPDGFDYVTRRPTAPGYPLRPEIIESAYYLRHYTKDPRYIDMGRTFLRDLEACCRTDAGYATLESVVTRKQGDLMPSYFLAETLKYLYLLFAPDDALDLEHVVLTTEAHPLRRTW
ncbi:MAG TPA: glycoside hydrolase family 47 protein [Haliangiales bacterium]|nr:glycoside hydrolase family 47 protein [Haliangiales bacterium]